MACYQCFKAKDKRCAIDDDIVNDCIAKMIEADAIAWLGQKPTRRHDIVAANLYSGLLKEVFPLLKPWLAAEGRIIFSGVLAKELPATLGAALECGYRPLKTVIRGKWSAGLLKRSPV